MIAHKIGFDTMEWTIDYDNLNKNQYLMEI